MQVQEDIVHSGQYAARLSGTQSEGYSYAASVKVPIEPGRRYTVHGWLRVDAVEPGGFAPCFKCGVYEKKKWVTNSFTLQYDLSRLGTWQELECTVTVLENANRGLIALEKRTTEAVTATLCVDDVELVAVEVVSGDDENTGSVEAGPSAPKNLIRPPESETETQTAPSPGVPASARKNTFR